MPTVPGMEPLQAGSLCSDQKREGLSSATYTFKSAVMYMQPQLCAVTSTHLPSPPAPLVQTAYTYLQVYVKCTSSDIIKQKSDDHKLKEGTKVLELNTELKSTQAKITDKKKNSQILRRCGYLLNQPMKSFGKRRLNNQGEYY